MLVMLLTCTLLVSNFSSCHTAEGRSLKGSYSHFPSQLGGNSHDQYRYFKLSTPERDGRMGAYGIPFVPRKQSLGFLLTDISDFEYIRGTLRSIDSAYFCIHLLIVHRGNMTIFEEDLQLLPSLDITYILRDMDGIVPCDAWVRARNRVLEIQLDMIVFLSVQELTILLNPDCEGLIKVPHAAFAQHTILFATHELSLAQSLIQQLDWVFTAEDILEDVIAAIGDSPGVSVAKSKQFHIVSSGDIANSAWSRALHFLTTLMPGVDNTLVVDVDQMLVMSCWEYLEWFPGDVRVRQPYGWEIIKFQGVNAGKHCPLRVLRIPLVVIDGNGVGRGELSEAARGWLYPEGRWNSTTQSWISMIAIGQIAGENARPIAVHEELMYSRVFEPQYHSFREMWLQIWHGEDSRATIDAFAGSMEAIDRLYLSVLLHRWMERTAWAPTVHSYNVVMTATDLLEWTPSLGSYLQNSIVCGVNREQRSVMLCPTADVLHAHSQWSNCSYMSLKDVSVVYFPVSILEADDPGQVMDYCQLSNGWSNSFRNSVVSQLRFNGMNERFIGTKQNVRQRRIAALRPFFTGRTLAASHSETVMWTEWGYCQDAMPREARLTNVVDNSHITCSLEDVRTTLSGHASHSTASNGYVGLGDEEPQFSVTIVFTTCRRLKQFLISATALVSALGDFVGSDIVDILVIDDSSSMTDRLAMMAAFPEFTFILKSVAGHAQSLNLMMRLVLSRYLLYLEDDWRYLSNPALNSAFGNSVSKYFSTCDSKKTEYSLTLLIRAMVEVLRRTADDESHGEIKEPIAQILFNEQCHSYCARGLVSAELGKNGVSPPEAHRRHANIKECDMEQVGHGGWRRTLSPSCPRLKQQHDESTSIVYLLHEFGLAGGVDAYGDRLHGHTIWPGLSLNPGIWDLTQIRHAMNKCFNQIWESLSTEKCLPSSYTSDIFNNSHVAFEHIFTIKGSMAGLNVAFLPAVLFMHIGETESAYSLNNFTRPWH